MILRPLEPEATNPPNSDAFVPAWPVVERLQKRHYESCWMITQPSHAALAGQLAGSLASQAGNPELPQLSPDLIRAIAMHDAGWGMPDFWLPLTAELLIDGATARLERPNGNFLDLIGRIRPGVNAKSLRRMRRTAGMFSMASVIKPVK